MRVFVAGATGVIGRRVVPLLRERGHEVTGHGSDIDLFDPEVTSRAVAGHDVVVNLATAIPSGPRMALPSAWELTGRLRTEGAGNIARAAHRHDARLVQESVVTVYADGGDDWIDEEHPTIDEDLTRPPLEAERHALTAGGVALRFGFLYGPDAAHTRDELDWARKGLATTIGEPEGYHPDLHLDDAATAVLAALNAPSGVYNVVDDEPLRRRERAEVVAAAVGREGLRLPPLLLAKLGPAGVVARSRRVSNDRFENVTGWHPAYPSIREGYPTTVGRTD